MKELGPLRETNPLYGEYLSLTKENERLTKENAALKKRVPKVRVVKAKAKKATPRKK